MLFLVVVVFRAMEKRALVNHTTAKLIKKVEWESGSGPSRSFYITSHTKAEAAAIESLLHVPQQRYIAWKLYSCE